MSKQYKCNSKQLTQLSQQKTQQLLCIHVRAYTCSKTILCKFSKCFTTIFWVVCLSIPSSSDSIVNYFLPNDRQQKKPETRDLSNILKKLLKRLICLKIDFPQSRISITNDHQLLTGIIIKPRQVVYYRKPEDKQRLASDA